MALVVDEKPFQPPRFRDDDMVPVSVVFEETELRELLLEKVTSHECCGVSLISSLQLTAAAYLRSISRDGE